MRSPRVTALLASIVVALAFVVSGPSSPRAAASEGDELLAATSRERARRGLPALTVHPVLVRKAQSWAERLAREQQLRHSHLPDGNTADWRKLGENVGRGASVGQIHAALMTSATHRANILDSTFTSIGIGVSRGADGRVYVVEEFMELAGDRRAPAAARASRGTRRPAPAAPPPPTPAPPPGLWLHRAVPDLSAL